MSIASRLPLLVGIVLGAPVAACSSSGDADLLFGPPTSPYCKELAKNHEAGWCGQTCVGEKTATIAGADLCAWEKRGVPLDCASWCNTEADRSDLACALPDADMQRLQAAQQSRADGESCPYAAKLERQEVVCRLMAHTSSGCNVEGRRPAGWTARGSSNHSVLGAYFASCAELEAISVDAFLELASELVAYGAPDELVARCEEAAREEVAHASWVGALARRFGAEVPAITRPRRTAARPLVDIALENAIEGCVRELFGAAQARVRACRARDVEIRGVMVRIADDEARHADLSAAVAAFLDARLSEEERTRVRDAMNDARRALRIELAAARVHPALEEQAGVPSADLALALFDVITTTFAQVA